MSAFLGIVLCVLGAPQGGEGPSVKLQDPVNVQYSKVDADPKKKFYMWVADVEEFQIRNANPNVEVELHPLTMALLIRGNVEIPLATRNSLADLEGRVTTRIVRVTIDRDRILIETPPDIPIRFNTFKP